MAVRVGVNGFGRIGRVFFRAALGSQRHRGRRRQRPGRRQDPGPPAQARLGPRRAGRRGRGQGRGDLRQRPRDPRCCAIKDPAALPWKELGVDIVVESTGLFRDTRQRLQAPAGGRQEGHHHRARQGSGRHPGARASTSRSTTRPSTSIVSNASCTTNCLATGRQGAATTTSASSAASRRPCTPTPTTSRSTTSRTRTCAAPARGAVSMIPTTTGAATAVGLVLPELKGKLDGIAIRVPTVERVGGRPDRRAREAGDGRRRSTTRSARRRRARSRASSTPPTRSWCRATSTATRTPRSSTCRRPRSSTATW